MRGAEAQSSTGEAGLEVLWSGEAHAAIDALRARGMRVTRCSADRCAEQVAARAPDLLVVGSTEAGQGQRIAASLRSLDTGTTPSVIVLTPDQARSKGNLHPLKGMTYLPWDSPAPEVAEAIENRLQELTSRSAMREVTLAWQDVDAWLASTARDGSAGFLIVRDPASALALGPDGRVAPKSKPSEARDTDPAPRAMTFVEVSERRLRVLTDPPARTRARHDLRGASIAVVHADEGRREAYSKALQAAGAEAHAFDLEASQLEGVPSCSPTLIAIEASAFEHASMVALLGDARLASTCWLVVDESRLAGMTPESIVGPAALLCSTKRSLDRDLEEGTLVLDRIERFGPAGWLKVVGRRPGPLTLLFRAAEGRGELQLVQGKIRSASFARPGSNEIETGRSALQASLALRFGKVLVGAHDAVCACEQELAREPAPSSVRPRESARPYALPRPVAEPAAEEDPEPRPPSFRSTQSPPLPSATPDATSPKSEAEPAPSLPAFAPSSPVPSPSLPASAPSPSLPASASSPSSPAPSPSSPAPSPSSPAPSPSLPASASSPSSLAPSPSSPASAVAAALHPPTSAPAPAPSPRPNAASRWSFWLGLAACLAAGLLVLALLRSSAGGSSQASSPAIETARELAEPARERQEVAAAAAHAELSNRNASASGSSLPAGSPQASPDVPFGTQIAEDDEAEAAGSSGSLPDVPSEEAPEPAATESPEQSPPEGLNVGVLLARAKRASAASRHAEAQALLAQLLERRPNAYYARFQMALTLLRQRQFAEAHEHIARAVELNPASPRVWLLKGDALIQEGRQQEAIAAWKRCLQAQTGFEECKERLNRWTKR